MNDFQSYTYVGPDEILTRVEEALRGAIITQIDHIREWVKNSNQTIKHDQVIATFIINQNQELVISDRHTEHVLCAGGEEVLSAGELTFVFAKEDVYVEAISNQSTGYCPKTESWMAVDIALNKISIDYPSFFTHPFEFRYCENCGTKSLIKEAVYECAVCGVALDQDWNIDRIRNL